MIMDDNATTLERRKLAKTYKNVLPRKRTVTVEVCRETYNNDDEDDCLQTIKWYVMLCYDYNYDGDDDKNDDDDDWWKGGGVRRLFWLFGRC